MIRDFKKAKENLKEIADVINSFKSEAVQLRLLELVLSMEDTVEVTAAVAVAPAPAPAPVAAPAPAPVAEEVATTVEKAKPVEKKKETRGRKPKPVVVAEEPAPEIVEEVKPEVVVEPAKAKKSRAKRTKKPVEEVKVSHDRPGPSVILRTLAAENYFSQTRTIGEVVKYCLATYNFKYASTDLSGTLARLVKDNILKREKNPETNTFEYTMV